MQKILSIDIETYSSVSLTECGVDKYVESEDFKILLFGYAYDEQRVQCIDLTKEELPEEVMRDLSDQRVTKTAFNAVFEMTCLQAIGAPIKAEQWECTMVKSAMCGLPLSLKQCSEALGLEQRKMDCGKMLIKEFSLPKGKGQRALFDEEKWELFKEYNAQDVEVERQIRQRLDFYPMPKAERRLFALDYEINKRGVLLDSALVEGAIAIDEQYKQRLTQRAEEIVGKKKPVSVANLKEYLHKKGIECASVTKASVKEMQEAPIKDPQVKEILSLREELSKSSTAKYITMRQRECTDGRARGLLQFYATRTGRWAGRGVQVQNLPQNHLEDLDNARRAVAKNDSELLTMLYEEGTTDILSQLIRTAFVAPEGYTFAVADFSAIEARVIAWLAGEEWRKEVFATTGKIYEASAAAMFGVPIEECGKGSIYRQKGKIAELALGYQGGVGALRKFGADKMGLTEEELREIVSRWRKKSPHICELWGEVETAMQRAILLGETSRVKDKVSIYKEGDFMSIELPSKRVLHYYKPAVESKMGGYGITYWGVNQTTSKWAKTEAYGGKIVENIVQAIARDCLALAMLRMKEKGWGEIVMHVHDEVIVQVPKAKAQEGLEALLAIMAEPVSFAPGLLLRGDGYTTPYYKKD